MRMLLHVGTHKTGTTSIQRTLAESRGWLADRGILYPDTRPFLGGSTVAHFRLAHALTGVDADAEEAARAFLAHLAAGATDDDLVVLSAEPFYRHVAGTLDTWSVDDYWPRRRAYLTAVADALADWDVTVLLHLRPPADLAASLYLEAVAAGTCRTSFERFLEDRRPFFEYSRQVAALEAAFDRVVVDRYGHDAVGAVMDRLGVSVPPATITRDARSSPDPRLVLWLREQPPAHRSRQRRFIGSPWARAALDGPDGGGLWRSAAQRDAFLARLGGPYGPAYFPAPPDEVPPPATLTDAARRALDRRYRAWRPVEAARRHLPVNKLSR